ncbi:MAG: hypothetical protein WD097_02020 [Balneolales bacterium]
MSNNRLYKSISIDSPYCQIQTIKKTIQGEYHEDGTTTGDVFTYVNTQVASAINSGDQSAFEVGTAIIVEAGAACRGDRIGTSDEVNRSRMLSDHLVS